MWKNLPGKNCRWEGAIAKLQVKNLHVRRYKNFCRWGAIPILPAVARPHPSELFLSTFLHVFVKMTFYQLGGYDHTAAQLTEGRSARDQPKQPPAKKIAYLIDVHFLWKRNAIIWSSVALGLASSSPKYQPVLAQPAQPHHVVVGQNSEVVAYCSFLVLLLSLTLVVSSYLVLQWFHLALLVRVGGMFFLGGFISGSVNPEMITWQPISFGGVRFLDDRSGSLFFEGFIVTDDAGFLSFGHLWLQSFKVLLLQTFTWSVVTTRKLLVTNCNLYTWDFWATGPERGLQDSNCNLTTPDFLAAGPSQQAAG